MSFRQKLEGRYVQGISQVCTCLNFWVFPGTAACRYIQGISQVRTCAGFSAFGCRLMRLRYPNALGLIGVGYGGLWSDHKGAWGCNTIVCLVLTPDTFVIWLIMRNRQATSVLEAWDSLLLGLQVREPRHMADIVCLSGRPRILWLRPSIICLAEPVSERTCIDMHCTASCW